jgi:hypothetical protein
MASLRTRQRKDGSVYTSVLYVHAGKQTSSSFNDHGEALQFKDVCDRLGPAEALRIWGAAKPSDGHTVKSFIDGHLDALSGVENKTIAEYRRYLTRDIEPTLAHIPLSTLGRTDISRWVNKLREAGSSRKTIQNKLGFLSGCLNAAVREGLMPANPAAGVRLPRTVAREMTFLTKEEYALLRAGFTQRYQSLLDFLVVCGCRFSEATALTPSDVDRINNTGPGSGRRAAARASINSVSPRPGAQSGRSTFPSPFWTNSTTAASGCSPTGMVGRSGSTAGARMSGCRAWPRRGATTPRTPTRLS